MQYRFVLILATSLLALATSCQKADETPGCGTPATVRNLTGLDGCGYVLQLDNGKRLEPHGTLWQNFALHDGDRVTIAYEAEPAASVCMAGEGVRLTCIEKQ